MNRRGFLGTILAVAAAPAIVRADSLMRIIPRELAIAPTYGNQLLTIDQITREALEILNRELAKAPLQTRGFSRDVIEPAMRRLADGIERDQLAILRGRRFA